MSKSMQTKIITALVMLVVILPPIIMGGIFLKILFIVITALAAYEIAGLKDESNVSLGNTLINEVALLGMLFVPERYLTALLGIWLVILFSLNLFDEAFSVDQAVYTFVITTIIGLAARGALAIYDIGLTFTGMIFVGFACYICDSGAYFFGSFMGKHKMIPRISPNKTWEGAVGGYVCGAAASLIFGAVFCHMPVGLMITASLVLPVIAEIGDLAFSSIKRKWGMKDFGSIFPGHGGILDRIDSYLMCLMVFYALIQLWGIL